MRSITNKLQGEAIACQHQVGRQSVEPIHVKAGDETWIVNQRNPLLLTHPDDSPILD